MKRTLTLAALVASMGSLTCSAQEISQVLNFSKPVPTSLERGSCGDNMAIAPGLRFTRALGDRYGVGLGIAHEWRSVSTEQETDNGTVPLTQVSGRSVLLQLMGQYRIFTCTSKCQSSLGVMLGTDVSLPYRTNAQQYNSDGSEMLTNTAGETMKAGLAFRAGLRYSVPMCESMGFFMEPQMIYKAVLDRTDEAAQYGREAQAGDRWAMGMQGGIYMKLSCSGHCPFKAPAEQ